MSGFLKIKINGKEDMTQEEVSKLMPSRGHPTDAGLDLKVPKPIIIKAGEIVEIDTKVCVEIKPGYMGLIVPRSSTGVKKQLSLLNTVGVIDASYRGSIRLFVKNNSDKVVNVHKYDRLFQLVIIPVELPVITVREELSKTERGGTGFGGTGQ